MEDLSPEIVRKIIADGIKAPSGENAQPWRFIVEKNCVYVCNIVERDSSLYNFGQHGSYVAHGALIENMAISASHYGYAAKVEYPPAGENVVAKLTFTHADISEDPLYPQIATRHTNRYSYEPRKLTEETKRELVEAAEQLGGAKCVIVDSEKDINDLAEASVAVERLMFENRFFHRFYYQHFFFKLAEEDRMNGFYLDVLGLSRFERIGIYFTSFWPIARIMGLLRMSALVRRQRVAHYKKSGAFAAIVTPSNEKQDYIDTGRAFERLWLKATQLGVELQPCVGVMYLYEGLIKSKANLFTKKQENIVKEGRNRILEKFGDRGEGVPMFFRLGYAPKPAARSFRHEPTIDFLS